MSNNNNNQGWQCPMCKNVLAPTVAICPVCAKNESADKKERTRLDGSPEWYQGYGSSTGLLLESSTK